MPLLLAPIDFSETSLNAARYAALLGKAIGDCELVLYTAYPENLVGADGTPITSDMSVHENALIQQLENLQVALYDIAGVPTVLAVEPGEFSETLPKFAAENNIDLIAMGITGASAFEQTFGTSNVLEIIRHSEVPVLVVPPHAEFEPLKKVVLAVELHNVASLIPFPRLITWLKLLKAKVHIAHVHEGTSSKLAETEAKELKTIQDILQPFEPEIHVLGSDSFAESLNHLMEMEKLNLMVTFPQKHTFFDSLFSSSKTKNLVFHSHRPVLAMHPKFS